MRCAVKRADDRARRTKAQLSLRCPTPGGPTPDRELANVGTTLDINTAPGWVSLLAKQSGSLARKHSTLDVQAKGLEVVAGEALHFGIDVAE